MVANGSNALTQQLKGCYTGIVHDIMRGMGLKDFTLPPELRPILPDQRMAGPAFTIEGRVDRNADPHETLLEWTGLLSRARSGHVWVCQPNTDYVALMGELSAETLKNKGLTGCVVDGLVRDVSFMRDMSFQTWCRGYTPRDIVGYWLPRAVDEEIRIGDVWIRPGDYLLGDLDGLVRIPVGIVAEVIGLSKTAMSTENAVRSAILAGTDPREAYLQFGKF